MQAGQVMRVFFPAVRAARAHARAGFHRARLRGAVLLELETVLPKRPHTIIPAWDRECDEETNAPVFR